MSGIPSKFATCSVSYGDAKHTHLSVVDHESFDFYEDEEDAMRAVRESIKSGDRMVALMRVEALFKAKNIELERIE